MRTILKNFAPVVLTTLLAAPLLSGCAAHVRYYDTAHRDYHPASGEVVYYGQWENDTHRQHVDLKHRKQNEQQEYWDWRHNQH